MGHVLKAKLSGWSPKPDSYLYSWQVDGSSVSNQPTFTPNAGEVDPAQKITLSVTAVKAGYQTPPAVTKTTAHKTKKATIIKPDTSNPPPPSTSLHLTVRSALMERCHSVLSHF